jgi:hypothetical protein
MPFLILVLLYHCEKLIKEKPSLLLRVKFKQPIIIVSQTYYVTLPIRDSNLYYYFQSTTWKEKSFEFLLDTKPTINQIFLVCSKGRENKFREL